MTRFTRHRLTLLALGLAAALVTPAHAAGLFDRPVEDRRLAEVRGGFGGADGGLIVSFGIQRAVLIDGTAVAAATDAATLLLVQRGAGNGVSVAAGSAVGTVLQNTLDNQKLQTVTTLDVTATSLQAFRSLAWQSSLRSAISDSARH